MSRTSTWRFTKASYTNSDIVNLSKLTCKDDEIKYLIFATCKDDTGSYYLQGFVKTTTRFRLAGMIKLMGFGFFFNAVGGQRELLEYLSDLSLESPLEYGDKSWLRRNTLKKYTHSPRDKVRQGYRSDLIAFKRDRQALSVEELMALRHPKIFERYPGFVNKVLFNL